MAQHKWHKEIKAWADGAEIEHKWEDAWYISNPPKWSDDVEYRIKPQPKEPKYLYVYNVSNEIKLCEAGGFIEVLSGKQTVRKLGKIKLEVQDD